METRITFKGSVNDPVGNRWEEGFQEAYQLTLLGKNPFYDGKYGIDWGKHGDGYGNGFGEGITSSRMMIHRVHKDN